MLTRNIDCRQVAAVLALISNLGCTASYVATKTGTVSLPSKPSTCDFAVTASTLPQPADFQEIGVIDVRPAGRRLYTNEGIGMAKTIHDFKQNAAEAVCQLGGDVVVAEANGLGDYVRGVVFARKSSLAMPTAPREQAPSQSATREDAPAVASPAKKAVAPGPDACAPGVVDPPGCQSVCESQKQVNACHRVGAWYELGNGVEKNVSTALRFYQLACEQGSKPDCMRVKVLREKNANL